MLVVAVKLAAVTLVMVLGLLLAARAARAGGRPGGPGIRVVGRHGLAKGATVAVLEVDGRRFLVGAGEQHVSLLAELDPTTEALEVGDDAHDARPGPDLALTARRVAGRLVAAHRHARTPHRTGRPTTPGPRIGPLDRLRSLTVRSHVERPDRADGWTRPIHDHPPA